METLPNSYNTMQFIDQTGYELKMSGVPKRILSLVPSQTELLHYLGLEDSIVGITRFCIHPAHFCRNATKIGGTKQFDFEKIRQLKPDLIIGNKEENYLEGIVELRKSFPVWLSDICTVEDALEMIKEVGVLTGVQEKSEALIVDIRKRFEGIRTLKAKVSCAYFIWDKPMMVVGGNNFIHHLIERIGWKNLMAVKEGRYPAIDAETLIQMQPDVVFLSSEPYPFNERHQKQFAAMLPNTKVILVDGEMFSWYGNRMLEIPKYLNSIVAKMTE